VGIKLLAKWYEVGETTIANIIHNRTWRSRLEREAGFEPATITLDG
jgi:hypothetical protein